MKNFFLLAAILAMPLMACNATSSGNKTESALEASAAGGNQTLNLGFLKKMGLDVSKLHTIGDTFNFIDFEEAVGLEDAQVIKLLPMVQSMNSDGEIEGGYYIVAAKALPEGNTMLIFGVEYGDSGTYLMGIYDRDANLLDFMQLGNCYEFMTINCNDEMTQGKAQVTNSMMKFSLPNEFTLAQTTKVVDWQRDASEVDEGLPTNFTKVHWLVQTLSSYDIDGQGRITLVEQKEVKRQGNVDPDYQRWSAIGNLGHLPASDPNRIERLSVMANDLYKQLGRGDYDADPSYHIQMVLAEYFDSNPQTLLQWIYNNRNTKNLIVEHFEQIFANGWRNKYTLVKAIEQMRNPDAQKYLEDLTAQWGPSDAVG